MTDLPPDWVPDVLPAPAVRMRGRIRLPTAEESGKGLAAIIGKWPGDETDEQVAKALEDLS